MLSYAKIIKVVVGHSTIIYSGSNIREILHFFVVSIKNKHEVDFFVQKVSM